MQTYFSLASDLKKQKISDENNSSNDFTLFRERKKKLKKYENIAAKQVRH